MPLGLPLLLFACADESGPEPACAWGEDLVEFEPGEGPERVVAGTRLLVCDGGSGPEGRWVERYPSGAVAADGQRHGDTLDGVVTVWADGGAFVSSVTWSGGEPVGPRRFVAADGRIVEVDATRIGGADQVGDWRTFPYDTPVDEWDGERRVLGTTYRRTAQ